MANLQCLTVVLLVVGALCVEGWPHNENSKKVGKMKRGGDDSKGLRDLLEDELENWKMVEMEEEELLELREASGDDSDDTDESGEAEESSEDDDNDEGILTY